MSIETILNDGRLKCCLAKLFVAWLTHTKQPVVASEIPAHFWTNGLREVWPDLSKHPQLTGDLATGLSWIGEERLAEATPGQLTLDLLRWVHFRDLRPDAPLQYPPMLYPQVRKLAARMGEQWLVESQRDYLRQLGSDKTPNTQHWYVFAYRRAKAVTRRL